MKRPQSFVSQFEHVETENDRSTSSRLPIPAAETASSAFRKNGPEKKEHRNIERAVSLKVSLSRRVWMRDRAASYLFVSTSCGIARHGATRVPSFGC